MADQEKQIQKVEDITKFIKIAPFLTSYTDINPNSGIKHQLAGIATNKLDKNIGLTQKNKDSICKGLQEFVNQVQTVIDDNSQKI